MAAAHTGRPGGRSTSTRRSSVTRARAFTGSLLLEHALETLTRTASGERPSWLGGPLVIVASGADPAARAVTGAVGTAGTTVCHWQGPQLGREIGSATRADGLSRLLRRLTGAAVCTVDAVDRLGSGSRQRTFVQLFDAAVAAGTLFCLSLARPPALADVEPQLATRLSGGLVVALPPEMRPDDSLPPHRRAPTIARILRAVARQHDLTTADLTGPGRRRAVATARSVAMYLARQLTDASLYAIGHACGGRDHTTVMHGVQVVTDRLARDPALAADLRRLIEQLTGTPPHRQEAEAVSRLSIRVS